jgi:hypothetical protein
MSKANEGSTVPVQQFLKGRSCMNTIYLHPFSFQMSIILLKDKTSITGTKTRFSQETRLNLIAPIDAR